jgi:hypothetical protein
VYGAECRLLVRSDTMADQCDEVLQIAFGWDDEHLNRIEIRTRECEVYCGGVGLIGIDAMKLRLCDIELRLDTAKPVNPRISIRCVSPGSAWHRPGTAWTARSHGASPAFRQISGTGSRKTLPQYPQLPATLIVRCTLWRHFLAARFRCHLCRQDLVVYGFNS